MSISQINLPITDPAGIAYSGPTPSNSLVTAQFPSLVGVNPTQIVQIMGQRNTNTWTAQYKTTDANGNQYLELATIDVNGNLLEATIVEQIDQINANNLITDASKTYFLYDVDDGILNLVVKYRIDYEAQNITTVSSPNQVGTDANGNPVFGPITDPSGNPLYQFTFKYLYNHWLYDASGNETHNVIDQVLIDSANLTPSTVTTYAISWYPFENFLFNNTAQLFNFDMFLQYNNGQYPVIQDIDSSGIKHYYSVTYNAQGEERISPTNLRLSELQYFTLDSNGNMLDINNNVVQDVSGNKPSGPYLILTSNAPNGSGATLNVTDPITGQTVSTPVVIFNYAFANIVVDPVTGEVSFDGPVLIQLNNMLVYEDTSVDNCCIQINNMISDINNSTFKFGKLDDYQELITEVNTYTTNLDAAKIQLDIEQVQYLEQYAANIQSMTGLFGQLVIQLNSASLVDSESICQRIKTALTTIYDGLQGIKAFKLAIGQQNLLKISQCILSMSSKLNSLYGNITLVTSVTISHNSNTYNPVNPSSVGALFKLQESLWYFAEGLPSVTAVGSNGTTYYQSFSNSQYWFAESFYVSNFNLSTSDQNDLSAALTLISNLNNNISDNVNMVINNPDVVNLQNSLNAFNGYNSNLQSAKNNLVYKLGLAGFKLSFRPNM